MLSAKEWIGPATREDLNRAFYPITVEREFVGTVLKRGDLVVAIGGFIKMQQEGEWFALMDVPKGLRTPRAFRYVVRLFQKAKSMGATKIWAICDERIPRAREMMEHLGFVKTHRTYSTGEETGELWVWLNS